MLGGGSSINGQMANRGAPTDYAEWEARGAEGWEWDNVLPYFKKVERDLDFTGRGMARTAAYPYAASRSSTGRSMPRRSPRPAKLAGMKFLPDQNGEFVDGYFPVTHLQRLRAARLGRDGLSRRRDAQAANLTISTDTQVKSAAVRGHALRRRRRRWSTARKPSSAAAK